jgi:hypothetical protein
MLVVPAIARLTVDGRFVEPKGAVFATAVDHHTETACSPGCRFGQAATVIVDECCRAAARTPSPSGRRGCAGGSRRHWRRGNGRSLGVWSPHVRLRRRAIGPQYDTCSVFITDLATDLQ